MKGLCSLLGVAAASAACVSLPNPIPANSAAYRDTRTRKQPEQKREEADVLGFYSDLTQLQQDTLARGKSDGNCGALNVYDTPQGQLIVYAGGLPQNADPTNYRMWLCDDLGVAVALITPNGVLAVDSATAQDSQLGWYPTRDSLAHQASVNSAKRILGQRQTSSFMRERITPQLATQVDYAANSWMRLPHFQRK